MRAQNDYFYDEQPSCRQIEYWSSNPEDAGNEHAPGSIPSRKALELHFSQLIMYILTTLEFPTHHFDFHLLTTSACKCQILLFL